MKGHLGAELDREHRSIGSPTRVRDRDDLASRQSTEFALVVGRGGAIGVLLHGIRDFPTPTREDSLRRYRSCRDSIPSPMSPTDPHEFEAKR